ncbi:GNAT family N-acetyltransferase [Chromobacterium sphagni]|uniref:N-acetyltransferase domain-containing protein n=1 Tax=Chromobacterium sphagni TaxID=1903179 RepID=A0A1S1WWH4_9NEIS|nr:GNAT family N-acetyltransferase [Chromobacterium sphagni]OHX11506.1 hypothetical protein BI347_17730 [Chromobacterium sphagni]OHX17788.1 hypothetical protein BI344_20510 [Chromobacterium sphagni]
MDKIVRASIRPMREEDSAIVLAMMTALAAFERKSGFRIGAAELRRWQMGELPPFGVLVAEEGGALLGYAAYYTVPFKDDLRPALMLKGLYVEPAQRGRGVGRLLLRAIARLAREKQCGRLQWFVLKDNDRAKAFYRGCGAAADPDWERWGLAPDALDRLADSS